jgi:transcriptional regulator with XRE-family HTH domain
MLEFQAKIKLKLLFFVIYIIILALNAILMLFMPIKMELMDIKKFFGANLKHYRKKQGLSQEKLSEKLDISVMHLSKIERGLTFVSVDLLEKLSKNLQISVAHLFCETDEEIYNDMLNKFDRITEKYLIKAIEDIKSGVRQDSVDN